MKRYKTRIELWCGQNEGCPERLKMYHSAHSIAKKHKTPTFFDSSIQGTDTFMDAYLYPCSDKLESIIKELQENDIEFDNIDLPPELNNTALFKRLIKKFPPAHGVEVNTDYKTEKCEFVDEPMEPFSLWDDG